MSAQLPQTMRAVQWITSPSTPNCTIEDSIAYTDSAPLPLSCESLPPNTALVKVAYASLNPVDYKLPELLVYRMLNRTERPLIPCGDYSGTVISSTISGIAPGDKVFGRSDPPRFGALAEYLVVRGGRDNVVKVPENLKGVGLRDFCTIGVAALTALQCLETTENAGSGRKRVLINGGSGGTGIFGVQIAKFLGWEDVVATCSTNNVEFVEGLGANGVVDYKKHDVVKELKRRAREEGKFDLIIDNVDSPEIFWASQEILKRGGSYVTIAGTATLGFAYRMCSMLYTPKWLGGVDREVKFLRRKSEEEGFARIAGWIAEGRVKPVIAREFDLKDAKEAFKELKSGRVRGKLVVKVAND